MSQEINSVFQSTRNEANAIRLLQKMSKHYNLTGNHPHHGRPSAVATIRALVNGELDLIDEQGRRFWDEDKQE